MRDEHRAPLLATPGPVPVPEGVTRAMSAPLLHHRTEAFTALLREVQAGLQALLCTEALPLVIPGSGSTGMEAALVSFASPGRPAVCVGGGKFGCRWAEIARAYGLETHTLEVAWGDAADPAALAALLRAVPEASVVTLTACETSTGVWHPVEALCAVAREVAPDALLLVDGITAVGVHPLPMDALGIDALVVGGQKIFALPPGLAVIAASDRALGRGGLPRYTLDLHREHREQSQGKTAFTPPTALLMGLRASLEELTDIGLAALHQRHHLHAEATRAGLAALGLPLVAAAPCDAVTAFYPPAGIPARALQAALRAQGVVTAGGQGPLTGRIVRFGHLGSHGRPEILTALSSLELALSQLHHPITPGAALAAAQQVYQTRGAQQS